MMTTTTSQRAAKTQRTFRVVVIQLVIIALIAGVVALGPRADAGAQTTVIEAPQALGIVANQSDRLAFGDRVSSSSAVHAAALLQTCSGSATDTTYESITLGKRDEDYNQLIRQGVATALDDRPIDGHPNLERTDPGFRWSVTYCRQVYTKTTPGTETCVLVPEYDYSQPPTEDGWVVVGQTEVCTSTPATSEEPVVTNSYVTKTERRHPQAEGWVKDAVEMAFKSSEEWDFSKVFWNSSPGYESRQIIGLPTFLSASPRFLDIGEREFDWEGNGPWPKPFEGFDGPSGDITEITVDLAVSLPTSQWQFEQPYGTYECSVPGRLFNEDTAADEEAIRANSLGSELCHMSWIETSVATDGDVGKDDTVKLEAVQLLYDYTLTSSASRVITELASEGKLKDGDELIASTTDSDGSVEWGSGQFTTDFNGSSQEFVIGEVQTYQVSVDSDVALTADLGAGAASPWLEGEANACQKARGWFIVGFFAGPICDIITGIIDVHLAILEVAWDGVQLIGTIARAVASGLWSLIKGCASMGVDFFVGLKDTAETVLSAAGDPAGTIQEISDTASLVAQQLADPETRGEFLTTMLFEFAGELGSLDMILKRDADGLLLPELQDDLTAGDWLEFGGRIACEVIVAFFGGKIKDLAKGSKLIERIIEWMDNKGITIPTIKIPDTILCVVAVAGFGVDAYEIAQVALGPPGGAEQNSFPGHTLVLMADGTHVRIDSINIGDQVMSWDEPNQHWEAQTVLDQWSAIDDGQLATATLVDGSTITATDGHLFWVESTSSWTELELLDAGDELLTPTGAVAVVEVAETLDADRQVWELTVTENHNFAVFTGTANVLVHNSCASAAGFSNSGGRPLFRQNPDGSVTYDSDAVGVEIDNVLVDADGNPIVVKTEGFEVVYQDDGTVTIIETGPPVVIREGGIANADGSVTVENPDGTTTVIDDDGQTITVPDSACSINSFPTGTRVLMGDGTHLPIEEIQPGDAVRSFDFARQAWVSSAVAFQWSAIDEGAMASAVLSDGSTISATDHHLFWVASENTWTEIDQLQPGNLLFSPEGLHQVSRVEVDPPGQTVVWELSIVDTHNFTVQAGDVDLLVHNCGEVETVTLDDGSEALQLVTTQGDNTVTTILREDNSIVTITEVPDGTIITERPAAGVTSMTVTEHPDGRVTVERASVTYEISAPPNRVASIEGANGRTQEITLGPNGEILAVSGSNIDPFVGEPGVPDFDVNDTAGSATHGLVIINGEPVYLGSGAIGPAYHADIDAATPGSANYRSHVEGHAIALMDQRGIDSLTVTIDYDGGACGTCQRPDNASNDLREPNTNGATDPGQTLYVISPNGDGVLVQEITSNGTRALDSSTDPTAGSVIAEAPEGS